MMVQVEKLIKELPSVPADWSNGDVNVVEKNFISNGTTENGTNLRDTQSMLLERIASEMNRLKFYIAHAQVAFAIPLSFLQLFVTSGFDIFSCSFSLYFSIHFIHIHRFSCPFLVMSNLCSIVLLVLGAFKRCKTVKLRFCPLNEGLGKTAEEQIMQWNCCHSFT